MEPTPTTYGELRLAYDTFNARLFDGELPACLLTLQREKRTYGYFSSARFGNRAGQTTDEIALNPEYFAIVPVIETLQTIAHEMTHLWQAHFGKPGRGRYHNAEWADKMQGIGLMSSSTGRPGGRRVGDHMADYPIDGGPFASVVAELIETKGFGISWYDRLAPARALYPVVRPGELQGVPDKALEVAAESGVALATPTATLTTANRSNRVKFTCPSCSVNVWGKPSVRVSCVPCNVELIGESDTSVELHRSSPSARVHVARTTEQRGRR